MLVFRFSRISGRFEIAGTSAGTEWTHGSFKPPCDISYRDRVFTVKMDLPGAGPDDISIEASDNSINIFGNIPSGNPPGPCRLMESPSGPFRRTINFPGNIAPDKVVAAITNGVLEIQIPAPDLDRDPTVIEVKITDGD
jgi:HSP20 family protein